MFSVHSTLFKYVCTNEMLSQFMIKLHCFPFYRQFAKESNNSLPCFFPLLQQFTKERRSIIPAGDTSKFIPSKEADIAILEEPEHLNWYHHGNRWTDKFNHVVGVVHTNYLEYIKREKFGAFQAFLVKHINNIVARAYCDKVRLKWL